MLSTANGVVAYWSEVTGLNSAFEGRTSFLPYSGGASSRTPHQPAGGTYWLAAGAVYMPAFASSHHWNVLFSVSQNILIVRTINTTFSFRYNAMKKVLFLTENAKIPLHRIAGFKIAAEIQDR